MIRVKSCKVGDTFDCDCHDGKVERALAIGRGYYELRCVCGQRWLLSYTGTAWKVNGDEEVKL